jgi:membrane associated rhomboid family serine protease
MSYQEKEYRRRLSLGQGSNALITLIAINLILFVILAFMKAIYHLRYEENAAALNHFYDGVLKWFVLPADIKEIGSRPWAILTFMFTHDSFWRIIGNMLWLWTFGYILQDLTGSRKIFPVFIYGSLAGAIAFILAVNFLPSLSGSLSYAVTLEASAGVMAIAAAVTTLTPGYRIFPMLKGGIPVWVLTAIYFIIDLVTIPASQPGASTSHLFGALTGFLFIYSYRKGYDWGGWMNNFYDWVINLFNPDKPKKRSNIKKELFYKSSGKPYKKTPILTEKRIDEILDKINQDGYHSLTDEEKDLLKKASKEDF